MMTELRVTAECDKEFYITVVQDDIAISGILKRQRGWWNLGKPYAPRVAIGSTKMHWTEALKRACALMEKPE